MTVPSHAVWQVQYTMTQSPTRHMMIASMNTSALSHLPLLLQVTQHHNSLALCLPYHVPKSTSGVAGIIITIIMLHMTFL